MDKLAIISWNISLDSKFIRVRLTHILKIIEDAKPDVICLQEVRYSVLSYLLEKMNELRYFLPPSQEERIKNEGYGTLTFIRFGIEGKVDVFNFKETYMGRDILRLTLKNGLQIFNLHLESLNTELIKKVREDQLQEVISLSNLIENSSIIICGDLNMRERIKIDRFQELETGVTYVSSQLPLDRVLYKSNLTCHLNSYLGTIPFRSEGEIVSPSDHYGLNFTVEYPKEYS